MKPQLNLVSDPDFIEIDKGIPIPPLVRPPRKWPWNRMKVGDSFFIEGDKTTAARIRGAANERARTHPGEKYTVRTKDKGARCWRIK